MGIGSAREGDVCQCVVHGGSVSPPGSTSVYANDKGVLRHGDAVCGCGGLATSGSTTVFVERRKAQRMLVDAHSHGGIIVGGSGDVFLGSPEQDAAIWSVVTPPECAYLEKWDRIPSSDPLYDASAKGLSRFRAPYRLDPPRRGSYQFYRRASPEPVSEYDVTVRGHKVTIIAPVDPLPRGAVLPTPEQVAAAVSLWPDSALFGVDTVVLSPTQPVGHETDVAYTVAAERRVGFCARNPNDGAGGIKTGDVDWAMVHEGGHVTSGAVPSLVDQSEWDLAMRADWALSGRGLSLYGDKSPTEDYAEGVLLYALTVNTPCEGTARRLFPHRYAMLERHYAGSFPSRGGTI